MSNVCFYNNHIVTQISGIAIQVTMIFTFLTIFFFLYVVKVEKSNFNDQIDLIITSLTDEYDPTMYIDLAEASLGKENAEIAILGMLETLKRNKVSSLSSQDSDVESSNNKIATRALTFLIFAWSIIIVLLLILFIIGFCLPIGKILKESLLIVLFVGLTELTFLKVIASKFISASPEEVKKDIAVKIKEWIKDNGLIKTG